MASAPDVPDDPDAMWELLLEGSDDQADTLGIESFAPDTLPLLDEWLAAAGVPLDDEDAAALGFCLGRVLVETHGGGLARIREDGHPLDGEWTISGFSAGLAEDYHVPFFVSAWRIGVERTLTAAEWYRQVIDEGRPAPSPRGRGRGRPRA